MRLFRGRIRLKVSSAARAARKEKRMVDSRSADELVRSFVLAVEAEDEQISDEAKAAVVESDDSGAEFWNRLDSTAADRFQGIPIEPEKFIRGPKKPSRASRLLASRSIVGIGCSNCYGSMACGCVARPAM